MKRIIPLLLAVLMVLSLFSCGLPGEEETKPAETHEHTRETAAAPYTGQDFRPVPETNTETATEEKKPTEDDGHEHDYKETVAKEPTCAEAGEKKLTCSLCGKVVTEEIPAAGHNYTTKVTRAATCTKTGEQVKTCSVCGEVKKETIAKKAHKYSEEIVHAATCTAEGEKHLTCTVCGAEKTEVIKKLPHSYAEEITQQPTCTAEGVKTFTCTVCSDSYTESIAKVPHSYVDNVVPATCTATGSKTSVCSVCGDTVVTTLAIIPHSYELTSGSPATCTAAGSATYTCTVCNDVKVEEGEALGHAWTAASCTAAKTCSRCSAVEGEALGHAWKEATCTDPKTCTRCKLTEGEALGHNYQLVSNTVTCTKAGVKTTKCTHCGKTQKENLAALGHTTHFGTCDNCNKVIKETAYVNAAKSADTYLSSALDKESKALSYMKQALASSHYTGTASAVVQFGFMSGDYKRAADALGNYAEFAELKQLCLTIYSYTSSTFSGTVTTYGDSRDLATIQAMNNCLQTITPYQKQIGYLVAEWPISTTLLGN